MLSRVCFLPFILTCLAIAPAAAAEATPRRVLLLYQGPDGHPPTTHEYKAGLGVLAACLKQVAGVEAEAVDASEPWEAGPERLAKADGVVIFLCEGAKWASAAPRRLDALSQLAQRKGGIVALHWGVGTKDAAPIPAWLKLAGACHGGPDRKYQVLETDVTLPEQRHPILTGVEPFRVKDEFYYQLKVVEPGEGRAGPRPVLLAKIDDEPRMVAWAWERPDGGRSFGFTGLHFHANWERPEYRRLAAQAVLWSVGLPIPKEGLDVTVPPEVLKLP